MKILNEPKVYSNGIQADDITLKEICNSPVMAVTADTSIAGAANFKMRAIIDHIDANNDMATIKIDVQMYALDNQPHTFNLTSTALKFNRCMRASGTIKKKWHTIFISSAYVNYCGDFKFDLRGELISGAGANQGMLFQRMLSMLDNDQTADVELVGTDGSIRAHGCLLAAASPYLRTAFYGDGDLKERRERRLTMPDVNIAALRLLKQFLYTGYVDVTKDSSTLMMVLSMASRNLMPDFGRACISSLDECTAEELWSLLHDAFEHKQRDLMLEIIIRFDTKKANEIRSQLETS